MRDAVDVVLHHNGQKSTRRFQIPDAAVGRFSLVRQVKQGDLQNWAVGELAFVRYGAALAGEAEIDGELGEWSTQENL